MEKEETDLKSLRIKGIKKNLIVQILRKCYGIK